MTEVLSLSEQLDVQLKAVRTFLKCQECNREKKAMQFIRLAERPLRYCETCRKSTLWETIYHLIKYDVYEHEDGN